MDYVIKGYKPESLFHFFEQISAIPRGSGNEKGISEFLMGFAAERGLEAWTDELHNVVIRKAASAGAEGRPAVMLQGHLDMVCEKVAGVQHDFERDGIELVVENGVLRANGTTLGSDNGAAVALMMAVLDDGTLEHPPLECVFTVQEETGLAGAQGIDKSRLKAKMMINLDSEEEGVATVSCAGGLRYDMTRTYEPAPVPPYAAEIDVAGLRGGHSGMDIDKERANAIKLAARLAACALRAPGAHLANFSGGSRDNAIAREAKAVLAFNSEGSLVQALDSVRSLADDIAAELGSSEPDLAINVQPCGCPDSAVPAAGARAFLAALELGMHGVLSRDMQRGGFVVSSVNLGVASCAGGSMHIVFNPRSSVESLQDYTLEKLELLAQAFGFSGTVRSRYPGWAYAEKSELRPVIDEVWREVSGSHMRFEAIHAGLECGLFAAAMPGLDAVAIGPTLIGVHSPDEHMPLDSYERTWELVTGVLRKLAHK